MKLSITGVSGLLGLNAAVSLRHEHQVSGTYLGHPVNLDGVDAERVDVLNAAAIAAWLKRVQPDVVLHTAGLTNVDNCETAPDLATRLNVDAAVAVAAAAAQAGARLVHISTDHLFDGSHAMYTEDDPTSPVNEYARTKLDAEAAVRAAHPSAFVVRTNFYGLGHSARQSFSDWILTSLRRGNTLTMFDDVFFTPMLVNDLIATILELIEQAQPGIYNVAGGERLSKYAFAVAVAEEFGLDRSLLRPASVTTFAFKARRPHDMSLSTEKVAAAVGHPMPAAAAGLGRLRRLERSGVPGILAAATTGGR